MPKHKRRGGRDVKVHYLLDMCKMAERCGDVEKQKRTLETICLLFGVDPTQLTSQGIRGVRPKTPRFQVNAGGALRTTSPPELPTKDWEIKDDDDDDSAFAEDEQY